jgi:hypothetical protein
MPLSIPPGVDANGRRNAIFIPTDTLSAATLGTTGVELICYLSKGTLGMSAETERGTDDRECTIVSTEVLGNTTFSLNDLEYVWEPQDAAGSSVTNKAYNALTPNTSGFLIIRQGILADTALAAGQIVDKFPITLGPQIRKSLEGNNPAEKLKIVQPVIVGQGVEFDAVLVS